ncbi:hypothetical protein [Hyphomicrobium sp. 99]|uniref:hypothetical protein n=1 Tax=Hyphomicrobium sp. 99 TaxID=1163419 RepID=UPI001FD902E8|nr:hypothetical protein [Hyphomicrobium sp. 99]
MLNCRWDAGVGCRFGATLVCRIGRTNKAQKFIEMLPRFGQVLLGLLASKNNTVARSVT